MRYRQPRSINAFTIMLLLVAGVGVYVLIYLWPVYTASSRAKAVLHDYVPALYKANLLSNDVAASMMEKIKSNVWTDLQKAGIRDPGAKVILRRSPKEISLEAHFRVSAHFPFPDKTYEFNLSPTVSSDATRVNW